MQTIIIGIFFILHGMVHLLYAGQSQRIFELRPGMTWPDGSWAFSNLLGGEATRLLASIALTLTALGFLVGGLGMIGHQEWWRPLAVVAAVFSTLIFLLFWDGRLQGLDDKGGVGLLINLAILAVVLIVK